MTTLQKQRQNVEHKIEDNWNGLLWNDYLNCDGMAAKGLWEAERDQLAHAGDFIEAKTAALHISVVPRSPLSPLEKAREEREHQLETNGNGLLLNDCFNCDGAAANELWQAECEELEHLHTEDCGKEAKKSSVSPRDQREHELETNGNGLLLNDYFNCDSSAANDLWEAEREELDRVTPIATHSLASGLVQEPASIEPATRKEGKECADCSQVHHKCHCPKHELQREAIIHPEEKEETRLNLHPRRESLHQSAANSPTELKTRRGAWL